MLGFRPGAERFHHICEDLRQRACRPLDPKLPRLDPGDVEQVIDQPQEQLAMLPDVAEILLDFGGPLPKKGMFSEQLVEAEKRAERGPDLVADVREELALGSAGLLGDIPGLAHRLGLLKRLLDAFLFGDVPADAQEPLLGVFDNPGDQQELADLGISGPGKDPQLEAGQGFAAHRLLMKTQSGFKVVGVNQRVEPAADPIGARPARDRLERRAQGDHDPLAVEFPEDDTGWT